jgi:zinc/manganese transport system ATP-binding protein
LEYHTSASLRFSCHTPDVACNCLGSLEKIMSYYLHLDKISVSYGKEEILKSITTTIHAGELIAIVGPNGGGKSTFIKTLLGYLSPQKGKIQWKNFSPHDIAYLPQKLTLDHHFPLTVREVVAMGLYSHVGPLAEVDKHYLKATDDILHHVDLGKYRNKYIGHLSGGQFQRMLFARLMLQDKPFIILDEPFSSIDLQTKHQLMHYVLEWHKAGKTVLVVLHEIELVMQYFPKTFFIAGDLKAQGPTKDVTMSHMSEVLALMGS